MENHCAWPMFWKEEINGDDDDMNYTKVSKPSCVNMTYIGYKNTEDQDYILSLYESATDYGYSRYAVQTDLPKL